jgi:hypothetical protein
MCIGERCDRGPSGYHRENGYTSAMTSSRTGLGRYRIVLIGLVLLVGGVAAAGCFLTAAGRHSIAGALVLGALAGIFLLTGVVILLRSARRRGGVLSAKPTKAQRRVYWRMYRGPGRSAH